MREDLARVLYEKVRHAAEIRFAERVASITQAAEQVEVGFRSGMSETYDLVIGADGLHSAVRDLAFPPAEIRRHTLGLKCAAFRSSNVLGLERKFETHMEPNRYMATFTTRDGMLGNVFIWTADDLTPPARGDQARDLKIAFAGTGHQTARVLEECPDATPFYFDVPTQIEMPRWCLGRIVLLGDAAHALTLFSGRSASAAFAGASRLGRAIARDGIDAGLARYESEMRPVIDAILIPASSLEAYVKENYGAQNTKSKNAGILLHDQLIELIQNNAIAIEKAVVYFRVIDNYIWLDQYSRSNKRFSIKHAVFVEKENGVLCQGDHIYKTNFTKKDCGYFRSISDAL